MPKGKKFNAAEKHFQEKEKQYQNQIKALNEHIKQNAVDKNNYDEQIHNLQSENEQLKTWIERLLEYTELDADDIKKACKKDKRMTDTLGFLNMFSGVFKNVLLTANEVLMREREELL